MKTTATTNTSVERFLITDEKSRRIINPELTLYFESDQESARYLVELIRFCVSEMIALFFCGDTADIDIPEENWEFGYKYPTSGCERCLKAHEAIGKIFGDVVNFNNLPFVVDKSERRYEFTFASLKKFAEVGLVGMLRIFREAEEEALRRARAEEEEKKRKLRAEIEKILDTSLKGQLISPELKDMLIRWKVASPKIASPHVAVDEELLFSGDDIVVFCASEKYWGTWKWKWVDPEYKGFGSRSQDLMVSQVKVMEKEDHCEVRIEFHKDPYKEGASLEKFTVTTVFFPTE